MNRFSIGQVVLMAAMTTACADSRSRATSAEPQRQGVPEASAPSLPPQPPASSPLPASPDALDDVVEWVGELNLEEADSNFVADPNLRADPAGGWLYWDASINQARVYSANGSLEAVLGRVEDGPGEFRRVRSLMRLDDARLVSVDSRGRIAVWDPSTFRLLKDFASELQPVFGAVALSGPTILVATSPNMDGPNSVGAVLHVLDIDEERVVHSGFHPPATSQTATALSTIVPSAPRYTDDSVYVGIPIYDTVWALPRLSAQPEPRPRSVSSRLIAANPPPVTNAQGISAFRAWTEQSTFYGGFFPVTGRGSLLQAWGRRNEQPVYYYHLLDPAGVVEWEVESPLTLLEVDGDGLLYFWDRNGLVPSRIQIAKLK